MVVKVYTPTVGIVIILVMIEGCSWHQNCRLCSHFNHQASILNLYVYCYYRCCEETRRCCDDARIRHCVKSSIATIFMKIIPAVTIKIGAFVVVMQGFVDVFDITIYCGISNIIDT